jgi:hypothetical protein
MFMMLARFDLLSSGAVAQIDDQILSSLRLLKIKGGDFKLLTSPLIKSYLEFQGFKEEYFLNLDGVKKDSSLTSISNKSIIFLIILLSLLN